MADGRRRWETVDGRRTVTGATKARGDAVVATVQWWDERSTGPWRRNGRDCRLRREAEAEEEGDNRQNERRTRAGRSR